MREIEDLMAEDGIEGGRVLFKLGKWEIHAVIHAPEWVEIFHHCVPWDPEDDRLTYSYSIPGDPKCPMCGETQPDEIQALEQMHNMDRPARQHWGKSTLPDMLEAHYKQVFDENLKYCIYKKVKP